MTMKKRLPATLLVTALASPVWALEVNDQLEITGEVALIYGTRQSAVDAGTGSHHTKSVSGFAPKQVTLETVYKPNDKIAFTASALYEAEIDEVITPAEIDQAFVTWHAQPEGKLAIAAGKQYLPFGRYETAMVHDPLTLDFGEGWREKSLTASRKHGNLTLRGFVFEAKATHTPHGNKHANGYGLGVSHDTETSHLGADYLSNLAESGGFAEVNNSAESVPGIAVHGRTKRGRVALLGEHVFASKSFAAGDLANDSGSLTVPAKPAATHLEVAVDLNQDRTLAIAWNRTQQAAQQLGLPETAYGMTYRQPLAKGLEGAVEFLQATDYDGLKTRSLTAQVAYGF